MKHYKFPDIGQFRHVVKLLRKKTDELGASLPTLTFTGTVKLHGTNAAVVVLPDDRYYFQSRTRIISPGDDNHGFAAAMSAIDPFLWIRAARSFSITEPVVFYGEWCGGNTASGVALSKLPKMFVIFSVQLGGEEGHWVPINDVDCMLPIDLPEQIHCIGDIPQFKIAVNFLNPAEAQNELCRITEEVEAECPFAKSLGVSGVGEGVVWTCQEKGFTSSDYWFKVKGEKHSVTKVRTLASVDVEKLASVKEFAERVATKERCLQGIAHLKEQNLELSKSSTGAFLGWIKSDVLKEEMDTLEESGLSEKEALGYVGTVSRQWFFEYLRADL